MMITTLKQMNKYTMAILTYLDLIEECDRSGDDTSLLALTYMDDCAATIWAMQMYEESH